MNVLKLHKKLLHLVLSGVLCLSVSNLTAQTTGLDIHDLTLLVNDTLRFDFTHYHVTLAPKIEKAPVNGVAYFDPKSINGNYGVKGYPAPNRIVYIPKQGYLGPETIEVFYYRSLGNGLSVSAYKVINITVVPSYLIAEDDYAITTIGKEVVIDVLKNDFGSGTNLTIADIPNVNHGTAFEVDGGKRLQFKPNPGFVGVAHLNYTICDAQGSCDVATVSITVNSTNPPTRDSIFVSTGKNGPQVLFHDLGEDFVISKAPTNGQLEDLDILTYVPNSDFIGTDEVILTNHANNFNRIIQIKVIDTPKKNTFLFDDIGYTPKGELIEQINLLANDKGGNQLQNVSVIGFPNTQKGGRLVAVSSLGKGVYQYIPPPGFEGIDQFRYKATPPNSGAWETATCRIVVSNQNPANAVYRFRTPKNTPFVIGDHLPFTGYQFTNYKNGSNLGSVQFYPGLQTVASKYGQLFSGYNQLVYEPRRDVIGSDVFEFNYCAGEQTTGCPLVKVEIEIVEIPGQADAVLCAGSDCVWTGDANKDGAVDVRDILPIGLLMGTVGNSRPNASLSWYGQYSGNWIDFNTNLAFNAKHIDADGNGIINAQDTTAIRQFYGKYHNLTPEFVGNIHQLPFYIEEPTFTTIKPGDVLYAPIRLGNSAKPAIDAYGLTFGLDYDPALFKSVKVIFNDKSFMTYNSPILYMTHEPYPGKLEAGYTRTSGKSANGYGVIGAVEFIVIDDIIGTRFNKGETKVNIHTTGLMDAGGTTHVLNQNSLTFNFDFGQSKKGNQVSKGIRIQAYPNPTSNYLNVSLNGGSNEMDKVLIFDMLGKQVYDSGVIAAKLSTIDVSNLASGIYTLKVTSNGTTINSKIEVLKN